MKSIYTLFFVLIVSVIIHAQNFWKRFPVPTSNSVYQITVDSKNNILVFSTDGGYVSSNCGKDWKNIFNIQNGYFSVDPGDNIYLAKQNNDSLFISKNQGATWSVKLLPKPFSTWISTPSDNCVVVGTFDINEPVLNLYLSINGGDNWNKINLPINVKIEWFDVYYKNELVISAYNQTTFKKEFYLTENWGNTWAKINNPPEEVNGVPIIMGKYLIANCYYGVYRSDDLGNSWVKTNPLQFCRMVPDYKRNEIFLFDDKSIYSSKDFGASWNIFIKKSPFMWDEFSITNEGYFLTRNSSQLLISKDNGFTWTNLNIGNKYMSVRDIFFNSNQDKIFISGANGSYSSNDKGATWEWTDGGWVDFSYICINEKLYKYTDTDVFKSEDWGKNWLSIFHDEKRDIKKIIVNNKQEVYSLRNFEGLIYTPNDGVYWQSILPEPVLRTYFHDFTINSLNHIFVSLNNNHNNGVFRSFDMGETEFTQTALKDAFVYHLQLNSKDKLFALLGGTEKSFRVFSSTDEGISWKYEEAFTSSSYPQDYETKIWTDALDNVYISLANDGISLLHKSPSAPDLNSGIEKINQNGSYVFPLINSFAYDKNGYNYIATGDGLYRSSTPSGNFTSINKEEQSVPITFSLSQNYPNPFNPSTTISYQISAFSHVSLKVIDMLGREVATLVDEYKQPGSYQINFNASHVERSREIPSGIYFYRMQAGSFSQTKKIILMK